MGGEEDVVHLQQGAVGRDGLGFGDVESGAGDGAELQCCDECGFVDHGAAAGVDQHYRRFHLADLRRSDHASRLVGERGVDGDDVADLHEFVERHARCVALALAFRVGLALVAVDQLAVPPGQAQGDVLADAAEADDADALGGKFGNGLPTAFIGRTMVTAFAQVGDELGEAAQGGDDE